MWLRERLHGDDARTRDLHGLYIPELSPKAERGPALPPKERLLRQVTREQADNLRLLDSRPGKLPADPLLVDDYLQRFLIQHHGQHIETMHMVLCHRRQQRHTTGGFRSRRRLRPAEPRLEGETLPFRHHRVGGSLPIAFDNELPMQTVALGDCRIARRPVSNAEYLGFMEDGGYREPRYWSDAGWAWCQAQGVMHPEHWRRDQQGWWYGISGSGPHELAADAPVYGISHYEAEACARWAGGRLPHEWEWEVACRLGLIASVGQAWEWCANPFFPYPGFTAFPYAEYSAPWFDGQHYSLRGASSATLADVRRPSFRNFHTADKRHVFAGLRLTIDEG